jgi:phosphatidylinositol alpha-mannosyltransferase/D-inositol-3-phosphate glycosyltransferase
MGGQEIVVDALARQYLQRGHDVVVLAPHPRLPLRARDGSLPYPVVRHPRFYSTRYFVSWYRWFLNRLHKRHRTEILHCHGLYPPGYLAGLTRASRSIPTVITSHGGDVQAGNVRLVKPVLRLRILQGLAAADRLVAISRSTEARLRDLCPRARIVCIPNGVDLSPYQAAAPRPSNLPAAIQSKGYVLFLGRLKERKGVDVLLHALARLGPAFKVPVVIAGAGEEGQALADLSALLHLSDRVWFAGPVQHPAKAYLLQNAALTVVPSRISEAFGLVALESFAAGTPVIGTSLPGLADLVEPGKTGWLVPPDSPADLAGTLFKAWQDPEARRVMGQQARRQAQHYDWSVVAERHLDLYRELTAQRSARAA